MGFVKQIKIIKASGPLNMESVLNSFLKEHAADVIYDIDIKESYNKELIAFITYRTLIRQCL